MPDRLPAHATVDIEGVYIRPLTMHRDQRGSFTEAFRDEWETELIPVQWNLLHSRASTLRGMHVHHRHEDYQVLISGRVTIGLTDLRAGQPRLSSMFEVSGDRLEAVVVPRGVAHGFYFQESSVFVVGVTSTYDPEDDLAIHHADPGLGLDWPSAPSFLSERDTNAPSLDVVLRQLERYQPL